MSPKLINKTRMAAVGLELLYSSVKAQIKSQHDSLMCCLHWHMISNGFKIIGIGDSPPIDASSAKGSEVLPDGWNDNQDVYNLLYLDNKKEPYLFKCLKMDGILLIHIMRFSDETVCSFSLEVKNFVTSNLDSYDSAFVNLDRLNKLFKDEVIDKLFATKSEKQRQNEKAKDSGQSRVDEDDPLRVSHGQPQRHRPEWVDTNDPFCLGRRDLDPLAAGRGSGGGMVMDPFHGAFPGRPGHFDPSSGLPGPRLPRGAVPPGARFDPFGPPDPDGDFGRPSRSGPNPDHMRPPGWDDMFM